MITINLLPAELRPVERTPLPRFLVIVAGVAAGAVGMFLLVFLHFSWLPRERMSVENLEQVLVSKRTEAAEFQTLSLELSEITQRERALEEIYRSRTVWWQKLDCLCDLVPSYVGLTALNFKEPAGAPGAQAESAGTLKLECIVAKAEEKRVAAFRRILKGEVPPEWGREPERSVGEEFIADIVDGEIVDYVWKVVELPDYPDQFAIQFILELKLKPRVTPSAATTQAGRPAPGR